VSTVYSVMTEDADVVMFATKREAVSYAKSCSAREVLKQKLTKDAVLRLHNGGGGYVESEEVVWSAPGQCAPTKES